MPRHPLLILVFLAASPAAASNSARAGEARAVASELVQRLGAALRQELAAFGPDGAISVCKDTAPRLAGELSRRTGWRVARVSLRPRNALLGEPDAWEQSVLLRFERSAAAGEPADRIEYAETVQEPQGRYFRYMKALAVQPLCLTCHGSAASIPESVRQRLADEYPHDRALGYDVGQLRGAVTIKAPLIREK
ncbi:MAG: Tll0287-like domain-containing protein [Burkholderiales bacterium]